MREITNTGIL